MLFSFDSIDSFNRIDRREIQLNQQEKLLLKFNDILSEYNKRMANEVLFDLHKYWSIKSIK